MGKFSTSEILLRRQKTKRKFVESDRKTMKNFYSSLIIFFFLKLDISVVTGDHFKDDNQGVQGILKQPRADGPCVIRTNVVFTDTALSPRC